MKPPMMPGTRFHAFYLWWVDYLPVWPWRFYCWWRGGHEDNSYGSCVFCLAKIPKEAAP